jgi:hypothetical protein
MVSSKFECSKRRWIHERCTCVRRRAGDRLGTIRVSLGVMVLFRAAIGAGYLALADAGSF